MASGWPERPAAAGPGGVTGALSGAALVPASAATRWGIFHAGLASARDPKYTVVPQRQRLAERARRRRRPHRRLTLAGGIRALPPLP